MDRQLFLRLVIPLIILAAVSIFINSIFTLDGFFVNLSSELIGIVITVIYVDLIIRKNEAKKWQNVDSKMSNSLRALIDATIDAIRVCFGFGGEELEEASEQQAPLRPKSLELLHKDLLKLSKEVLEPQIPAKASLLDEEGWQLLIRRLQYLYESDIKILTIYGWKLSAEQYEILIEIQELLSSIMAQHAAGSSSKERQEAATRGSGSNAGRYGRTAETVNELLSTVRKLESCRRSYY